MGGAHRIFGSLVARLLLQRPSLLEGDGPVAGHQKLGVCDDRSTLERPVWGSLRRPGAKLALALRYVDLYCVPAGLNLSPTPLMQ